MARGPRIPEWKKKRVLLLIKEGIIQREICNLLHISQFSVTKIIKIEKERIDKETDNV